MYVAVDSSMLTWQSIMLTWHCLAMSSSDWRNPMSWVSSTSLGDGPPSTAGWFLGAAFGLSRCCRLNCPTDTPSALRGARYWMRGWAASATSAPPGCKPRGCKAPGLCCCSEPASSSLGLFWRRWTFKTQFIPKTGHVLGDIPQCGGTLLLLLTNGWLM